ncbi:NADH-ubiquinone oxidoreductase chain 6 [Manis javanica]|nr:NADH-ubiquinone oxidoreductase chain 6 [Manis javanica]
MIFHVTGHSLSLFGNNDICCIYFKYYFCNYFLGFSSKPSPIYGGFSLVVAGRIGCGIVVNFGGSFLGLMVFLIYFGRMLVVFGYTAAMAIEEYPEVWVSNIVVFSTFTVGVVIELVFVFYMLKGEGLSAVFDFGNQGDWVT